MKKFICKLIGHKFEYDHPSQATRCKCLRCGKKWVVQFRKPPVHPRDLAYWEEEK